MKIPGNVWAIILMAAVMTLSLVYLFKPPNFPRYSQISRYSKGFQSLQFPQDLRYSESSNTKDFLVYSPKCQIREQDPWNETIKEYFKNYHMISCSSRPRLSSIVRLNNGSYMLKIEETALKYYTGLKSHHTCCYSEITRVNEDIQNYDADADNKFRFSKCLEFDNNVLLPNKTEFIRVKCMQQQKHKSVKEVYRDAHALVPILPSAWEKMENIKTSKKMRKHHSHWEKLNVVILGIDSVSRLNLRRMMPNTFDYLKRNDWIELNGYTKIGENTFPNLMAILTGLEYNELRETCKLYRNLDDCPYIWKEFSNMNYITAYAEDTPTISTFNYFKTGFVKKPTDYYLRPFMLAIQSSLTQKKHYGLPVCNGPVSAVDHILFYARHFLKTFRDFNHFSLFWLNSLSHNDPIATKNADNKIIHFLKDLSTIGTYEDTIVILLSDHGSRFGSYRQTFLAYYEERLPFFYMWVPKWFRERYTHIRDNLVANQFKLTCPYDVHLTLRRILTENYADYDPSGKLQACPKCVSLFDRVPEDRSCEDAAIDLSWCMCHEFRQLEVKDTIVVKSGYFVKNFVVNKMTELMKEENSNFSLCSTWTFRRIVRAHEIFPVNAEEGKDFSNNGNTERRIIMLLVELNPGKVRYEAVVKIVKSSNGNSNFTLHRAPSLLTGYSKYTSCVQTPMLKLYCYCKKFLH